MVGSSDGIRRLLAVIAIGCAIGGILLASSAMPMLAADTPAAAMLGEEGVAAEHERAVQQALLGSALEHADGDESIDSSTLEGLDESDIENGEMDAEELERAIEEGDIDPEELEQAIEDGDIDPEALEEGIEAGDGSSLQLGGGSLPAGAMAGGAGGEGELESDITRAAVLTGMELQGDHLTDPQMSDALFGLGAIYAAMGGSTDGLPANADLEAEDDHDDGMTGDGLGEADTSSGGLLDVPTSSSGLDGGFGDAVDDDVVADGGMDFDGSADSDGSEDGSDDADGFDADGSDGTESGAMNDGDDDGTWDDEEETTDDSEHPDEDSETDDGGATADDDADEGDDTDATTDDGDDSSDPMDDSSDDTDDSDSTTDDSTADEDGDATDDSSGDTNGDATDDDSSGIDDADGSSDEPSTDETDDGSSDETDDSSDDTGDSSDEDEGFVASITESLGPLGDRPLLSAVLAVVVVVVAYVFLTKDDPIATLRSIPGRLVSLVMGAVVACSQLLERAVSALARVKSVAEIPGLIVTALVGALASMRQKAGDVRASLPIVGDSESEAAAADIDEEIQSSARERIRRSFYRLESMSTVYPLSVATPTDVAHDVKSQGVPAEPVDTIADAFRDVEYGDRDPERRLEQTTEAEATLQVALEGAPAETDDTGEATGAGPTEDR
ncbi:MSCRAMM family adhesin SdrC [Halobacteria archaeon AArc-curdl1]|uniref:MSCRAMM family adhesin SdrC n=1 Tax=Natronosalvus hydrolyticus TaxID=2979988 RepID=A0AAP3E547_9EURY|nr:MSCRAMM family adhesin SdrC [Halobacteria archaeon AArc-curdl1]